MRGWLLLALAGLSACDRAPQPPDPVPAEATSSASATPALPAPQTLAGEWRVAGIDGAEFNESYGLALSASDTEIWWEPRCAGYVRQYRITGSTIRLSPAPAASSSASATPLPVCAIGLPERLRDVVRALDAADRVVRTPSNGVEISGGGYSVLLFSQ